MFPSYPKIEMRTSTHLSIFPFPTFGYVPSRTLVGIVVLAARFESIVLMMILGLLVAAIALVALMVVAILVVTMLLVA